MHAVRAPVLGIALAAVILVAECLGLVAYEQHQRHRAAATLATQPSSLSNAVETRMQLQQLMYKLDKLDAELQRDAASMTPAERKARLRELYQRLEDLRRERLQLHDEHMRQPAASQRAY